MFWYMNFVQRSKKKCSLFSLSWCPMFLSRIYHLTNPPLDKMAAILADLIFKQIFLNESDKIPISIPLKRDPRCPIDNKPALFQVMTVDKLLTETMRAQFPGIYTAPGGDELTKSVYLRKIFYSWSGDVISAFIYDSNYIWYWFITYEFDIIHSLFYIQRHAIICY